MAEEVSTGGLRSFRYGSEELKLDEERKKAIEEGYEMASERKAREKRNNRILLIAAVILILGILGFLIYKFI